MRAKLLDEHAGERTFALVFETGDRVMEPLVKFLRENPTHGELLRYLFFDPEFVGRLIEMGRGDAERGLRLQRDPGNPWQVEPLEAFVESSFGS